MLTVYSIACCSYIPTHILHLKWFHSQIHYVQRNCFDEKSDLLWLHWTTPMCNVHEWSHFASGPKRYKVFLIFQHVHNLFDLWGGHYSTLLCCVSRQFHYLFNHVRCRSSKALLQTASLLVLCQPPSYSHSLYINSLLSYNN